MKRATVLVIIALLASAIVVVGPTAPPAAAHHCGGDGDIGDNGGGASAFCHGVTPGQPPRLVSYSESEMWAIWCDGVVSAPFHETFWVDSPTFSHTITDPLLIEYLGFDPTGEYGAWSVTCNAPPPWGLSGGGIFVTYFVYYEITPPVPVEDLRDRAAARIDPDPPSIETNPPFAERPAIVTLPTWLWITDPWEVIHESETQGFVTVEVTATPITVTWSMGDGGATYCEGPGIPWSVATDSGGTYCSYTYTSSSADLAGAVYDASATVTFEFEWWINGTYQGVFGTLDRATAFNVPVGEIQVVESGG